VHLCGLLPSTLCRLHTDESTPAGCRSGWTRSAVLNAGLTHRSCAIATWDPLRQPAFFLETFGAGLSTSDIAAATGLATFPFRTCDWTRPSWRCSRRAAISRGLESRRTFIPIWSRACILTRFASKFRSVVRTTCLGIAKERHPLSAITILPMLQEQGFARPSRRRYVRRAAAVWFRRNVNLQILLLFQHERIHAAEIMSSRFLANRARPLVSPKGDELAGEIVILGELPYIKHLGRPHVVAMIRESAELRMLHVLHEAVGRMRVAVPPLADGDRRALVRLAKGGTKVSDPFDGRRIVDRRMLVD